MPIHDETASAAKHTASQLAEMGYCERKMLLQHRYGARVASAREAMRKRGTCEHERFLAEGLRTGTRRPPVLGDCAPAPSECMFNTARRFIRRIADVLRQ